MKQSLYISIIGCLALLFSCQEDEVETWHGEDGVYFYVQWPYGELVSQDSATWPVQPYSSVNFFEESADTLQVSLRVMLAGDIVDHDRQFRIVVDQDSTTAAAENYVVPDEYQTIRAGEYYADVLVTVISSAALEDEELQVGLRLQPTEELGLASPEWYRISGMYVPQNGNEQQDGTFHAIRINDFITRPSAWTQINEPETGMVESLTTAGNLGFFSKEKYEYILEHIPGLTYDDFASSTTMPIARLRSIASTIAGYLTPLYEAGTPVLEADGRAMWVNGCTWQSVYGVPYEGN